MVLLLLFSSKHRVNHVFLGAGVNTESEMGSNNSSTVFT